MPKVKITKIPVEEFNTLKHYDDNRMPFYLEKDLRTRMLGYDAYSPEDKAEFNDKVIKMKEAFICQGKDINEHYREVKTVAETDKKCKPDKYGRVKNRTILIKNAEMSIPACIKVTEYCDLNNKRVREVRDYLLDDLEYENNRIEELYETIRLSGLRRSTYNLTEAAERLKTICLEA